MAERREVQDLGLEPCLAAGSSVFFALLVYSGPEVLRDMEPALTITAMTELSD